MTAAYCMYCSVDLTDEKERADANDDGFWDDASPAGDTPSTDGLRSAANTATDDGGLLAPDGVVDNTLTAVVGLVGGLVVGFVATTVVLVLTSSSWGVWVGIVAWLAATAHLARRRTVRDAVTRTAYAVSFVLLLVPFVAFGPSSETTELGTRIVVFAAMLAGLAVPAAIAAGFGFAVSRLRLGSEAE